MYYKMKIEFTKAEINHLLGLVSFNEATGEYCGNRKQYYKRSIAIKNKLSPPIPDKKHCIICGCNLPDEFLINTCYGCKYLNDIKDDR